MELLSLSLPFIIGFLLLNLFVRPFSFIKLIYSFVVGHALSSITFLFWIILIRHKISYLYIEFCVLLIVFLINLIIRRRTNTVNLPLSQNDHGILIVFGIIFSFAIFFLIIYSFYHPHGMGDALTIWNLKARFLFRDQENWLRAFNRTISWSHPDYPLFLPISIARYWVMNNNDSVAFPMIFAILTTISTILLLFLSLRVTVGSKYAFVGGLILLATPAFLIHGVSQFADILLGLLFLAVFVFQFVFNMKNLSNLILLGCISSICAWTKNEGVIFSLIFALFFLYKKTPKKVFAYMLGFFPILTIILLFKFRVALPSDIFESLTLQLIISKLVNINRHLAIIQFFIKNIFLFGQWRFNLLIFIIPFVFIKRHLPYNDERRQIIKTCLFSLSVFVLSEYIIYLITARDLTWQLTYSFNRLMLQLWPSFIFLLITKKYSPLKNGHK